jgi:hypothetical protein
MVPDVAHLTAHGAAVCCDNGSFQKILLDISVNQNRGFISVVHKNIGRQKKSKNCPG